MKIINTIAAATALALGGCATTLPPPKDVIVSDLPGELESVSMDDAVLLRVDHMRAAFSDKPTPLAFKTGEVWKRHFVGEQDARASLRLMDSSLGMSVIALGFGMRMTYEVDAVLTCNATGADYPLHAVGTEAYQMRMEEAVRDAIAEAITSMQRQVRPLMRQCKTAG